MLVRGWRKRIAVNAAATQCAVMQTVALLLGRDKQSCAPGWRNAHTVHTHKELMHTHNHTLRCASLARAWARSLMQSLLSAAMCTATRDRSGGEGACLHLKNAQPACGWLPVALCVRCNHAGCLLLESCLVCEPTAAPHRNSPSHSKHNRRSHNGADVASFRISDGHLSSEEEEEVAVAAVAAGEQLTAAAAAKPCCCAAGGGDGGSSAAACAQQGSG